MLTGIASEEGIFLIIQPLIDLCRLCILPQHHQGLCPHFFNMVVPLVSRQADAVCIEQSLGRITLCQIVTRLHFIEMVKTERSINQMSVVCGRIKDQAGFTESIQSDKGSCSRQIAGMPAFADFSHFYLAHLAMEELEPFVCQFQLAVIGFVIVVSLGHTVIDAAQRTEVTLFVLHQFGIVLQGLDGRLRLLHVQIDDTYLLIGHRPSQFVVTLFGIVEHPLGLLQ